MKIDSIDVVVGTSKWNSGGAHHKVIKVISHENYRLKSHANDIALLKLEKRLKYSKRVQKIKLSPKPVQPKQTLQVTGWGMLWVCQISEQFLNFFLKIKFTSKINGFIGRWLQTP